MGALVDPTTERGRVQTRGRAAGGGVGTARPHSDLVPSAGLKRRSATGAGTVRHWPRWLDICQAKARRLTDMPMVARLARCVTSPTVGDPLRHLARIATPTEPTTAEHPGLPNALSLEAGRRSVLDDTWLLGILAIRPGASGECPSLPIASRGSLPCESLRMT